MDDQQKFQNHIQNAVRDYLGKLYQNGHYTNPQLAEIVKKTLGENGAQKSSEQQPEVRTPIMNESEMMENYVHPTEEALEKIMKDDKLLQKRERKYNALIRLCIILYIYIQWKPVEINVQTDCTRAIFILELN